MRSLAHALLIVAVLLVSCGVTTTAEQVAVPAQGTSESNSPTSNSSPAPASAAEIDEAASRSAVDRGSLVVPLTLHVIIEAGDPTSDLSSRRTTDDLAAIANNMREIWAQADITFDPINVHELEVPRDVLQAILLGDTSRFFAGVNATFVPQDSQAINGFYVRGAFGVNGFTPQGSRLFFVVDEPSVHDERVSSHEVGHIFGLHHDLNDADQLMFSGTNGTGLSELEQTVSRYSALGLFPQDVAP